MKKIEAFSTDTHGMNLICPVHREQISHIVKITEDRKGSPVPSVEFYPACPRCIRAFGDDMIRIDSKFSMRVTAERTGWGLHIGGIGLAEQREALEKKYRK